MKNNHNRKRFFLEVVKRFEFNSKFQSMSVIVRNNIDDSFRFYIKGAPEKIIQLCYENSIPDLFNETLLLHTQGGLRVLACATKLLPHMDKEEYEKDDRSSYEKNLTFLGFIIFRNKLKRDTKTEIQNLNESGCKIVMATGDNPFTAISVAKECGLLKYDCNVFLCIFI